MRTPSSEGVSQEYAPGPEADDDARVWLSALADGDAGVADRGCAAWRGSAAAREIWHTYHLIGDTMRSQELAASPAHDAAFLSRLRERLAAEPAILAPGPLAAPPPSLTPSRAAVRRQPWLLPGAAAAGFAVVAGVLIVGRVGQPDSVPAGPGFAAAPSAAGSARAPLLVTGLPSTALPTQQISVVPSLTGQPVLLRDPLLDDYLRAHQLIRGGVPVAAPGGTLRPVEALATAPGQRQPESATGR